MRAGLAQFLNPNGIRCGGLICRFGLATRVRGQAVIPDALNTANSTAAQALDESVLNALGQLQGKERPDFVNQVIIIFLETALALLADLKWGSERSN
jgi:hypothetical protein